MVHYNNKHVEVLFQVSEHLKAPLWRYTHFREDSVRYYKVSILKSGWKVDMLPNSHIV